MRHKIGIPIFWAVFASSACLGQRVLHDSKRDAQAQAAANESREVLSGSLFEAQLKNLEQLGVQQLETVVRWQEVKMRAAINGFTNWGDVLRVLKRVDDRLAPYLDSPGEDKF